MDEGKYRYCKIFVKGADQAAVKNMLAALLGHDFERHGMLLAGLDLEVRRNADAADVPTDDFVRWPVTVELETDDGDDHLMVDTTAAVLRQLWDAGYAAVAACDFEEELPWSGGIKRIRT